MLLLIRLPCRNPRVLFALEHMLSICSSRMISFCRMMPRYFNVVLTLSTEYGHAAGGDRQWVSCSSSLAGLHVSPGGTPYPSSSPTRLGAGRPVVADLGPGSWPPHDRQLCHLQKALPVPQLGIPAALLSDTSKCLRLVSSATFGR